MTDQKTETEPNPPPLQNQFIAEVLIATATKLATEQKIKLVELIGHMEIAKIEVFNRNILERKLLSAQQAQSQPDEPAEDDGKGSVVAFSQDEDEGKDEK